MAQLQTTPNRQLSFRDAFLAMLGIGLVNMAIALDQTVVSTALPSIVTDLGGFEDYAWVASAYLLASLVTVPVFGRLGDFFGRKRFVVASVIVFTGASALCGLAESMWLLVLWRALQGIGGGMMVGNAFASIPDLFPDPRSRIRWQVIMSAAYGIGTAAGPSLGGWLSEHYGWRSAFLVNLPVGALSLWFIYSHLPNYRRAIEGKIRVDWAGAALIALLLGAFQLFIESVPTQGITFTTSILGAVVIVAGGGLYYCERRASHPILPLEMFRESKLVTLFALSVLAGFIMFSLIFFAPLLLQGGFNLSAPEAGILVTPFAACAALGSAANTRIVIRLSRPTRILTIGYGLMAAASFAIARATPATPHLFLETAFGAAGIGLGFILNNLNVFAQEIAGPSKFGITTALLQSMRMMGGMLGTSIVATIINRCYEANIRTMLFASSERTPADWQTRLHDPRILIDPALRDELLREMQHAGAQGMSLIEGARQALVASAHAGILSTTCAGVLGIVLVRRIAQITLHRKSF